MDPQRAPLSLREVDEGIIRDLYGAMGEEHSTDRALAMTLDVLEELGLDALSDAAVSRLAAKQIAAEAR